MLKYRFSASSISAKRIVSAIRNRILDIPQSLAWNNFPLAKENKLRIVNFKNIHINKRCFIIANGPSLNRTDLSKLKNEITFGMNRIYLLFETSAYRPTYYVAVNELVLQQYSSQIEQLTMPKFLNWKQRLNFKNFDKSILFLKSKMVLNDFFEVDITRPIVVGGTVTFVALQIAYYMGFQEVILIGLDHEYEEKGIPNETEARVEVIDKSHFHPDYFPKGSKWQLPDLMRSEYDYQLAKEAFENDGREILDATIDGKCKVFDKVEYSSLFNK